MSQSERETRRSGSGLIFVGLIAVALSNAVGPVLDRLSPRTQFLPSTSWNVVDTSTGIIYGASADGASPFMYRQKTFAPPQASSWGP